MYLYKLIYIRKELPVIIPTAQETVYTVITSHSQGSGFLYNDDGAVITNAHVVEGETTVYLNTVNGKEHQGTIIGYSNDTDVAVIHVPDLVGEQPFPLEVHNPQMIGEKIIALGSPSGLDNMVSEGYITHRNQSFTIGSYIYEDLYQISSPISVGSSGGPLVAKASGKIIAINSAKREANTAIGFSIPLYKVSGLIQSWIDWPMSQQAILSNFSKIDKQENFILPSNYDNRNENNKDLVDVNLIYTKLVNHK